MTLLSSQNQRCNFLIWLSLSTAFPNIPTCILPKIVTWSVKISPSRKEQGFLCRILFIGYKMWRRKEHSNNTLWLTLCDMPISHFVNHPVWRPITLLCPSSSQILLFLPGWQVHVPLALLLDVCASSVSSEPPVDPSHCPGSSLVPTSLCKQGIKTEFRPLRNSRKMVFGECVAGVEEMVTLWCQ